MTRFNLMLLLAILASALYLVRIQYESRRLFVEMEKASAQAARLATENEGLQAEKRAQATPLRVDKLARERLQMRPATPAITEYVAFRDGATPAKAAP
ncbi:MAG: cell division protein FtsL [Pseudomonadota bacterium]